VPLIVTEARQIVTGGVQGQFARLAVVIGAGVLVFFAMSAMLRDANLAVLRRRREPARA
jgi:hypothetical protein